MEIYITDLLSISLSSSSNDPHYASQSSERGRPRFAADDDDELGVPTKRQIYRENSTVRLLTRRQ